MIEFLVEVRKQGVAGLMFRGASEARAKGAVRYSAEVAEAVPPRRLGGKANTCPLSSEQSDGALSRSVAL